MKKLVFTTAVALVLATGAYAQGHHGAGMSAGGSVAAQGNGMGGGTLGAQGAGGVSSSVHAQHEVGATMGYNRGPTSGLYNRGPTTMHPYSHAPTTMHSYNGNYHRFSERERGTRVYDHYEGRNHNYVEHEGNVRNFVEHGHDYDYDHHGVVGGNFYEHGRHFRFRRYWHGEWVFLNGWDDCTAFAWVHIAPYVWAWRPIDVCIG